MRNLTRIFILGVVSLQLLFVSEASGVGKKVGQSLMQFLKLEIGARPVAMGGAFSAMTGDVSCLFWNPSGLAELNGKSAFFSHTTWIADIGYNAAAVGVNFGDWGTFGISALVMDYGTFYRTVVDPSLSNWDGYREEGTFTVSEYAIGLGYARRISERFSVGGQVKFVYQNLGTSTVYDYVGTSFESSREEPNRTTAVAFDLGTVYYFGLKSLRFAMAMQNFSNIQTPLTFRLGVGMNIMDLWSESDPDHSLDITVDALHPRDFSERLSVGAEYKFAHLLALRMGYKLNYDERDLTFGAGVTPKIGSTQLAIDYSYTRFGVFNAVHNFSLTISF